MKLRVRAHHSQSESLHEDSEGTWAVSYGDMVTLLLTFFIVFFSLDPNEEKVEKRKSLNLALVNELQRLPANIEKEQSSHGQAKIDTKIVEQLNGKVHEYGDRLLVEFPEVSFFNSGEVVLTQQGAQSLRLFMRKYLPYAGQYKVSIQAFTDARKVQQKKGRRFKDNLELSALRAISAMRTLQKEGLPLAQMEVAGFGEMKSTTEHLAEINKSEKHLELSRKVVLVIKPEDT